MDLEPKSLEVLPSQAKPAWVRAACADPSCLCPFIAAESPEGLPVLFVDDHLYRELPSFLVATVDKFAMLPWRGRTAGLFGRVSAREGNHFFGPTDGIIPRTATKLPEGLRPPELIVQDELHLISGPLGTMVGLYETAIEALCRRDGGRAPRSWPPPPPCAAPSSRCSRSSAGTGCACSRRPARTTATPSSPPPTAGARAASTSASPRPAGP